MKNVYLILDEQRKVIAVYDNDDLAKTMKVPLEKKFNLKLSVEKHAVNPDIKWLELKDAR